MSVGDILDSSYGWNRPLAGLVPPNPPQLIVVKYKLIGSDVVII